MISSWFIPLCRVAVYIHSSLTYFAYWDKVLCSSQGWLRTFSISPGSTYHVLAYRRETLHLALFIVLVMLYEGKYLVLVSQICLSSVLLFPVFLSFYQGTHLQIQSLHMPLCFPLRVLQLLSCKHGLFTF